MEKIHSSSFICFNLLLFLSIILNIFFFLNDRTSVDQWELSWTKRAAQEAEAVAAISCSGHGRAYVDGLAFEGKPVCDCNSCYGGHDCSEFSPECAADADSGNPLFLEPYWMKHAASSAVVVSGWNRMGYSYEDGSNISKELERIIRQLHAIVGNANTTGKHILFGVGSTQLINAAIIGLSPGDSPLPASVVASAPYYPVYRMQTDIFNSLNFKWQGDTSLWRNKSDSIMNFIEFVTSPNNPDCQLKEPILNGSSVKTIFDHAYFWPHFTAIPAPANSDLMIFTLSKLTGHAGSRFGWAFVKDEAVYKRMSTYLSLNSMGASRDSQLRALMLLRVVLKGKGREMFEFGYNTMKTRWEFLTQTLSKSKRFSLQKFEPHHCSFFNEVTGPSPAYAWVKCEREEDQDCYEVLRAAGIIGRKGSVFSVESRYVRLSLIKTQDDFDLLLKRIDDLVSQEQGVETL